MASLIVSAIAAAGVALSATADLPAAADYTDTGLVMARGSCERAVRQAIQMTGGELLSVQPAPNGRPICRVAVLVVKANGRPKRVVLRIPMD